MSDAKFVSVIVFSGFLNTSMQTTQTVLKFSQNFASAVQIQLRGTSVFIAEAKKSSFSPWQQLFSVSLSHTKYTFAGKSVCKKGTVGAAFSGRFNRCRGR